MEETEYFEQKIWEVRDGTITENNMFAAIMFSNDPKYGLSPACLKLTIANFKVRSFTPIYLSHNMIQRYVLNMEGLINNSQGWYDSVMKCDQQKSVKLDLPKRTFRTTFLHHGNFGNEKICVRISGAMNESNIKDTEKIFMEYGDFLSLFQIVKNFCYDYVSICNTSMLTMLLRDLTKQSESTSEKLNKYLPEISLKLDNSNTSFSIPDTVDLLQNEMDTFIEKEADNVDVLPESKDIVKLERIEKNESILPKADITKIKTDPFTSTILEGSCINIEQILGGLVMENVPLISLMKIFGEKLGIAEDQITDFSFPGVTEIEFKKLVYLNTRYLKGVLNDHLSGGKSLPSSVLPMFSKVNKCNKQNTSIMEDMLVYMTFYTLLSTQLQARVQNTVNNKSVMAFYIKLLFSPFIFPFICESSTKEVVIANIENKYKKFRENGVFDELLEDIYKTFGKDVDVSASSLKAVIIKICDVAFAQLPKFEVNNVEDQIFVATLPIKLISDDRINLDTLEKILVIESAHSLGKGCNLQIIKERVKIDSLDDIPTEILAKFELVEEPPNNENLIRFVKEIMTDNQYLNDAIKVAELMNGSFREYKGEADFNNFEDQVLIAFSLWDTSDDPKIQKSYKYFKEKIMNSPIDRTMALSLLYMSDERKEEDFSSGLDIIQALQ